VNVLSKENNIIEMECSVGIKVSTACDCESLKTAIVTFNPTIKSLLNRRVHAEIKSLDHTTDLSLNYLCVTHEKQFLHEYEDYQKTVTGCCDPFFSHRNKKVFEDLSTITESLCFRREYRSPYILVGRQLCKSCLAQLIDDRVIYETLSRQYPADGGLENEDLSTIRSALGSVYDQEVVQRYYESLKTDEMSQMELVLRPMQASAIYQICMKKDILCILATNYGKSLIQVVPSMINSKVKRLYCSCFELSLQHFFISQAFGRMSITVIVLPLITLAVEVEDKLKKYKHNVLVLTKQSITIGEAASIIGNFEELTVSHVLY
jgi:hypothetical protein